MFTSSNETKPGIYTTEFWTMLFSNALGLANLTGIWDFVPNKYVLLFMAIISAAYNVSRGVAKKGVAYDPAAAKASARAAKGK